MPGVVNSNFWHQNLKQNVKNLHLLTTFFFQESGGRDDASGKAKRKVRFVREGVERARRAHLNDLENLIPFFVIGFLYVLSRPDTNLAVNLYRCVAASRIVHTIVYAVWPLPQPTRFLAFMGAWLPTVYMGCKVALVFY